MFCSVACSSADSCSSAAALSRAARSACGEPLCCARSSVMSIWAWVHGVHPGPCLHTHGTPPWQGQLKGAPVAQHLAQRVQTLHARLILHCACLRPGLAEHFFQRATEGLLRIVQAVLQRKGCVHPVMAPASSHCMSPTGTRSSSE